MLQNSTTQKYIKIKNQIKFNEVIIMIITVLFITNKENVNLIMNMIPTINTLDVVHVK